MNETLQDHSIETKASTLDTILFLAIKYKNALASAVLILAALAGIAFFWMQNQQEREGEAAIALSRIAPLLDRGMLQEAVNGEGDRTGLKAIADRYDGTPSGEMASLLMANAFLAMSQDEAALKAFDNTSMGNPDLAAAVLAGKAAALSNMDRNSEASETFAKASATATNEALKGQYLVQAGDCSVAAGELVKAKDFYEKVKETWPGTTAAVIAQRSLWQLTGREQS